MTPRTRERILDGAAAAVALHGLAKLEMCDVSATSGVSRPTLYRYFPSRDALLTELARHEGQRFKARMLAALEQAPPGSERIRIAFEHVTRNLREHAVLQRLLDTDPAHVLQGLRDQFETLKEQYGALLGPLLHESDLVRRRIVSAEQLVDWTMRLMVSAYLLPGRDPEGMTAGLTAVYRILTASLDAAPKKPATARAATARRTRAVPQRTQAKSTAVRRDERASAPRRRTKPSAT